MMKIVNPKFIITNEEILENCAVVFNEKIVEIGKFDELVKKYDKLEIVETPTNSLLMAGVVNAHVHLEFSANKDSLKYGSFMPWLNSVIGSREELINDCGSTCISDAIKKMLESGTTAFGAISSYGMDLQEASKAKQKVVFFNEVIGSQAVMADALYGDFLARLDASKSVKRDGFYPAIAIHSPYSVHPILVKKALHVAKDEKLKVSSHFLESSAEREWLDESKGEFKEFFANFLKQDRAVATPMEFLKQFEGLHVLFTHATKANDEELDFIASNNHYITHCPISNRLLGNGALDITKLKEKSVTCNIATDGLSSNYSLNLFEEMRAALFMHHSNDLQELAHNLIRAATINPANALGLNCGDIAPSLDADMLLLEVDKNTTKESLELFIIMHDNLIRKIFINGEDVK
ncbi:MAG: metal-dependent hydrolase [Campylobacterota bacterium]|nr:metal-dependent hydrolase [Campylobacterota bacterium]